MLRVSLPAASWVTCDRDHMRQVGTEAWAGIAENELRCRRCGSPNGFWVSGVLPIASYVIEPGDTRRPVFALGQRSEVAEPKARRTRCRGGRRARDGPLDRAVSCWQRSEVR